LTLPDGSAFTIFLRILNEQGNGGFAGHNDWRLPTRSADTYTEYPHSAWAVNFGKVEPQKGFPEVASGNKVAESAVRAVRNA
jgi:hypothetical protein